MAKFSRDKGQRAEREVVKLLQEVVAKAYAELANYYPQEILGEVPVLKRNSLQCDGGGADIAGLDWLALEVKHCETLQLNPWWTQAKEQAKLHQTPVLIYKQNSVKWRVRMVGYLSLGDTNHGTLCDIELDAFLNWAKQRVMLEVWKALSREGKL